MKFILFYLLLFSTYLFSQSFVKLESNENLKKYKSVEITSYYNKNKKTGWSKKITLKNGKINTIRNYNKSVLTYQTEYYYNKKNDLDFEIVKFDINKGKTNDTINYSYLYNDKNQLIETKIFVKEFYSNFNSQNLPQTIESEKTALDSVFCYKKELVYDSIGNIVEEKNYSKIDKEDKIEINYFKYDNFKNLIEVKRNSIPKETYPIPVLGGRFRYEIEKYRYVYNKNNLWTEKYWIIEGTEYLIEKRKFK